MTDGIFQTQPIPTPSQAQMAADELLRKVRSEMERRAGEHIDGWRAFWEHPEAAPQAIADAMNGDAVRWLTLARLNVAHITAYIVEINKTISDPDKQLKLDDYVPAKYRSSPRQVTLLPNGYITIGDAI